MALESYVRVINYYETDQMQVVHHSNYARYLEEARLNLMDQVGLPYDKLEELGIIIPVLELHDYYIKSVTYGDIIEIKAKITKLTPVRFSLKYEIYRSGTDELLHRAETSHAFLDSEFKPMNLKKSFPNVYETLSGLIEK
ncbi:MAG: acyl-CoA thioesterase [Eubacterium sp.]|nr:acyl-CoA thioesterase [Eubacterium sp.]